MGKNPLELDSAQPITMDGVEYLIEGRRGSELALFNTLNGQTLTMTYAAVMKRAELSDVLLNNVADVRTGDAELSPIQKERKDFLLYHVEEIAYGKAHGSACYRPGYDPETTTQAERLAKKAAELAPLHRRGVSRSNLKKLVLKLKRQDSTGLVDGRSERIVDPFANIDPRLRRMMTGRVNAAKNQATAQFQQLATDVRGDWMEKYPDEIDVLPSDKTLIRKFGLLTKGRYTTKSAINRRSNENSPKRRMRHRPAFAPGEEVQVDSTVLDVEVRWDDGKRSRPTLTTFIDKATHSILAIMLTLGVKGVDLAYLLAKALSIPDLRPGPDLPFDLPDVRAMPWSQALLEAELAGKDTALPIIMPRRIMKDLGKDFDSNAFLAACRLFCIDVTNAAPGTGSDKPMIERFHRTLKDSFCRYVPGFTGGDPGNRGRDTRGRKEKKPNEKKDAYRISIHTLIYVLNLWVRHVWQNLETDALEHPAHPGCHYSPNTMYEALTYRSGCLFTPITPATYLDLLPVESRVITRTGIQVENRHYDTAALDDYRGKPSGEALLGNKWRVHLDPNNPAAVWLKVPDLGTFPNGGCYVECPWVDAEAFEAPFWRAAFEAADTIAALGYQIPAKERSLRSRQVVRGAFAAAEKEQRAAEERDAKDRLAAEQGMARPRPLSVVSPTRSIPVWDYGEVGDSYELFSPEIGADIMSGKSPTRLDSGSDAAAPVTNDGTLIDPDPFGP